MMAPKTIKMGPMLVNLNDTNHAVAVVPIYEPRMIDKAPANERIPLSTNETANDKMAVEDWITTVNSKPTTKPINRLAVSFLTMPSSLLPAANLSSVLNALRPKRKSIIALKMEKII